MTPSDENGSRPNGERRPARDGEHPTYDAARECPKCASTDVATTYRDDSHALACHSHRVPQPYDLDNRLTCSGCDDEHFDRTCRRCHFVWREEVYSNV